MKQQKKISSGLLVLVLGGAMVYLGNNAMSSVSADTMIDSSSIDQFKIIFIIGIVLVLASFVLLALASMSTDKK
jgi:multidrug transporter EmrE-like cation transporter